MEKKVLIENNIFRCFWRIEQLSRHLKKRK